MAEIWPVANDFPQELLQTGFTQTARPDTIRTSIDAGEDKLRRRYTTPIVNLQGTMWLNHLQYETLDDFYNLTLAGGVKRFAFIDPGTPTNTYEYRFTAPPAYTAMGGSYYSVSLSWERLQLI